jgi:putative FmdB family regulatory protein
MPIYEYECDICNYRFERMQSFWDEALRECPQCGKSVRRVIQPVGIVFKGSGFYITDNRQIGPGCSRESKPKELTEPKPEPKKESASTATND